MNDTAFIPGEDFDPGDPDEVELVGMVTEQDRLTAHEKEVRALSDRVSYLERVLRDNGIDYEERS